MVFAQAVGGLGAVNAFVPTPFAEPVVSPDTATLFRRTPYIATGEYGQAPTAVATNSLVPNGSEAEQEAALAAVISRASDWLDTICFHKADGTLAASPTTESGWITPKGYGLALICSYKPILQVNALAVGINPNNMSNLSEPKSITIDGPIIYAPFAINANNNSFFPTRPVFANKVYAVWSYTNGFPHTYLLKEAASSEEEIIVAPSTPGGESVDGIYLGTQLTIHDGANTEVIVADSVEQGPEPVLHLRSALAYTHKVPTAPDTVRISAVPWIIEQACISLTSALIKMRGARAVVFPQSPGKSKPAKQVGAQAAGEDDFNNALQMLKPFIVPVLRST